MNSNIFCGIVLKRSNVGETDRVVTILTKERGKMVCVAKGARKLTSSKLACLEPGCEARIFLTQTHSLPILTQAQLQHSYSPLQNSLPKMRKMFQVLEMLDALLIEEDPQEEIYELAQQMLLSIEKDLPQTLPLIRFNFNKIISLLGFEIDGVSLVGSLNTYIEQLTHRKMKAFSYLTSQ